MDEQAVDYSRKWYVMAAVGMGIFLSTIDGSIVNIALPTLVDAFGRDLAIVQWVVLAYLLTVSVLMLGVGRAADMIGKKPLYTAGFIIFTIGSVLCGLSPTVFWLIAFRVLQATGAAMILALGMAIITESFPPHERGKALGISGSMVSVGIVVGPTLGGFITDVLSWHWIFFVNLPVGIAGTIMVLRFVLHVKPPGGQRFDYWGALTLFASIFSLLFGLTLGQQYGFGQREPLLLFVSWLVLLIVFILIERHSWQPMVDLSLFKDDQFSVGLVTGFTTFVAIAGTTLLLPFYLQNVLDHPPREVGLLMAAVPIGLGFVAPLSGSLSDRFGTRPITVIGLGVLSFGYYLLSTLKADTSTMGFLVRFLPIGIGMGIFQSPNNSAIMGSAPHNRLGIVSGMLAITRSLGQTTGIALLVALWAGRVFRYTGTRPPEGATAAPPADQVAGLQDTFLFVVVVISGALLLSVWALLQQRRQQARRRAEAKAR